MAEQIRKSFILYNDYYDQFSMLNREERSDLIMAIFEYQREGIIKTSLSPIGNIAFSFIKAQLIRDNDKYQSVCDRNQANGIKGGRPTKTQKPTGFLVKAEKTQKPTGFLEKTQKPKKPDNDTDNDNDMAPPKSPSERKGSNPQKEREGELNARFELFWKEYPRKQSKANALKVWIKIKPDDALTDRIIKAVKLQKQGDQWQRENGKFIPLATTWLNGARWEDEIQPTTDASMKQVKEQSFDVKDFMQAALARSYGDDEY